MDLKDKFKKVFESGHSIIFQNTVKRIDHEWESRIIWEHVQLPLKNHIDGCDWNGFIDIEDCVDDCLKYIEKINKDEE